MASTDDSEDSDEGPQYSGIIQPPLINQLKKILDEYPDDGQILKEIIQNAEDAEAAQMKVLYDKRIVNQTNGTKRKSFKKYFQGPALCVYNTANFTPDDWKGIQMINSSVKEFDPVKVGRYGLGFKSVFHITDYPMIISGNTLLVIDPHQDDANKVCINMKLNKLHKYKKMDPSFCLNALNGLFGFSQDTLNSGNFEGTMFRFPLRQEKSNLSDNVYDAEKIADLFTSFKTEAPVELLFLKCLEKIELFTQLADDTNIVESPFFTVKLSDECLPTVRKKRSDFHNVMKQTGLTILDETNTEMFNLTINTEDNQGNNEAKTWFVVHCLKGKPLSDELIALSQDEALSYSPYVSIAVPLSNDEDFKGHVFCLMPLPLEEKSLTGYPVHVNGLFALNQSRRFVKWPSADQTQNNTHTNKAIKWNTCLLTEVLFDVYRLVIQHLIEQATADNFSEESIQRIYRSIPDRKKINSNWDNILDPLFQSLVQMPFLYSSNKGGSWMLPGPAIFKIFPGQDTSDVENSILSLTREYSINLVEVPEHVTLMLEERRITIRTLSRDYIASCLRENALYTSFSFKEKMNIFMFLVNDGNFSRLEGLELLPLQNDSFSRFGNGTRVYISKEEADLFSGQEASFVKQQLDDNIYTRLQMIANQGRYNLAELNAQSPDIISSLVQKTIQHHTGTTSSVTVPWNTSSKVGQEWLQKIWTFIQKFSSLSSFEHLHLIPDVQKSQLYRLSNKFLSRSGSGTSLSNDLIRCLEYLGIVTLDELPQEMMSHRGIGHYILPPTSNNIMHFISTQCDREVSNRIQTFNSNRTESNRKEFVQLMSEYKSFSQNVQKLLRGMKLFKEKTSNRDVSLTEVDLIVEIGSTPISYYKESLAIETAEERRLANLLNVTSIAEEDVVIDILQNLTSQYNTNDVNVMMKYVLENMKFFKKRERVKEIAKSVQFIPSINKKLHRAQDLFDPEDDILKNVIIDENKFPNIDNFPIGVRLLHKLGLKTWNDVTSEEILQCANHVNNYPDDHCSESRSKGLIELLRRKGGLLNQVVSGKQLRHWLTNIRFLKPRERKDDYPSSLPWFTEQNTTHFYRPADMADSKYSRLIGCIRPTLRNEDGFLNSALGLQGEPCVNDVITQLLTIKDTYETRLKPELLPLISDIYKYFNNHQHEKFSKLKGQKWVWTGNGFEAPEKIFLKVKSSDLNLEPFLYPLPNEFRDMASFFLTRGCIDEQTPKQLINVQMMIREKYDNGGTSIDTAKTDHQIIITILNSLKTKSEKEFDGVLFPIKHDDDTRVILLPAKECNYCKDDDELFGDEQHFVHDDISSDTAEKLGVPSVTDTLLDDAERLEEWGQTEPLTRRIKNLLEAYKDGLSVPKEIIQNADDAGATKVCFLYDERESDGYERKLLDKNMYECQGPALWAFNNAKFTEDDLKNITKLSGATKQDDLSKIGKFGLGFCSVYNLTEVPSFVTGNQMVIFDPHYKYLGEALKHKKQPGLKIDFQKNRKIVERKGSQFQPFNGVFGCNLSTDQNEISFDGTLFRLPLRTRQQAATSEISNTAYDRGQMNSLMKIFAEAGGNLLLFTQNVSSVEFYYLPKSEGNPANASLAYTVKRETIQNIERPLQLSNEKYTILSNLSVDIQNVKKKVKRDFNTLEISTFLQITVNVGSQLEAFGTKGESSLTKWIVSWASGTDRSKRMALKTSVRGVLPLASVACPIDYNGQEFATLSLKSLPFGFYKTSHVFCFLPLPVEAKLPVYINGSFAVSSDRRRLCCKTTDDKDSFESEWNEALMTDAVCNAYILLLEKVNTLHLTKDESYSKLWPVDSEKDGNFARLQESFYQHITSTHSNRRVFRQDLKSAGFQSCQFLDSSLLNTKFGEKAYRVCIQHLEDNNTVMMKLPSEIKTCFRNAKLDSTLKPKTLSPNEFYSKLVFPHLTDGVWDQTLVELLILHALDNTSDKMKEMLKENQCIPTSPNRRLRYPSEIVDRNSTIGCLFGEEDERFVFDDPATFSKQSRLTTLASLGMSTRHLPGGLLLDRTKSVSLLAAVCSGCAMNRCTNLIRYMEREFSGNKPDNKTLNLMQNCQFLPVLCKPKSWNGPWGGEDVRLKNKETGLDFRCIDKERHAKSCFIFESPSKLFHHSLVDLVCTSRPVFDRNQLPLSLYLRFMDDLHLQKSVTLSLVFDNLVAISNMANNGSTDLQLLKTKVHSIYKHLDSSFQKDRHLDEKKLEMEQIANQYRGKDIVLLNDRFVQPEQIVVHSLEDCSPHFFRLNDAHEIKRMKGLIELLHIDEKCSTTRVLGELKSYDAKYSSSNISDADIDLYIRLLKILADSIKKDPTVEHDISQVSIPDMEGFLRPLKQICVDEPTINSTESMFFTHDKVSYDIAKALGIRSKREHKIEECTKDLYSEDFGQHEDLITRIKRILTAYPCDGGVLKELVQNADDARASEVHIVIDFNTHKKEGLFHDSWKALQGPAILVYNDRCFSQADIEGIQKLGMGSKGEDPTKTGQYGVGFNAVYHLTDVPSFLTRGNGVETGELLGVFDPHCTYVPKASSRNPGRKFLNTKILKEDHPNVFACYHEDLLMKEQGTIFRFPLRTSVFTNNSKISSKELTTAEVNGLVEDFREEMQEMLLFVNNVQTLKISKIESGKLKNIYTVNKDVSGISEEERESFNAEVKKASKLLIKNGSLNKLNAREIQFNISTTDSNGKINEWLIVRRLGFQDNVPCPDKIKQAYKNKDLGLLPRGGVAVPLNSDNFNGRMFCFLPIPIKTGLPVHINGHFALDHEARRNLWTEEHETYRSLWNNYLFEHVVAPAYVSALLRLKDVLELHTETTYQDVALRRSLKMFHSMFPDCGTTKNEVFKVLICQVYRLIAQGGINLFPSGRMINRSEVLLHFYPLTSSEFQFPCVFNTLTKQYKKFETTNQTSGLVAERVESLNDHSRGRDHQHIPTLIQILKQLGIKLLDSSKHIHKSLKEAKVDVSEISADFVITYLKSFKSTHPDRCQLQHIDITIEETVFKKIENLIQCILYCQTSKTFLEQLDGLPLCLKKDGLLTTFKADKPIFLSLYNGIVEECSSWFVHPDLYDHLSLTTGLREFDVTALAEILPYAKFFSTEMYRKLNVPVEWDPDKSELPNRSWIERVWTFLSSRIKMDQNEMKGKEAETVMSVLSPLMQWCLLPCAKKININDATFTKMLFPVAKAEHVLDLQSFSGLLKTGLERLALPCLDQKIDFNSYSFLKHVLVNNNSPRSLLGYLYEYRDDIENRKPSPNDCRTILEYFAGQLDDLLQKDSEDVLKKLNELPLHLSVDSQCFSLAGVRNVLVLDESTSKRLVVDGIRVWAERSDTTLLRTNDNLTKLYAKLGHAEEKLEPIDVYINHILPKFEFLPRENHIDHLRYIRDNLLASSSSYSDKQKRTLNILKTVSFVPDKEGVLFTPNHFKHPSVNVFKEMCDPSEFPAAPFTDYEWKNFLNETGIQAEVTPNQVLQYVHVVETEGRNGVTVTDRIKKRSEMLTEHILGRNNVHKEEILTQLSTMKFVLPYKIEDSKAKIFPQPNERLICYKGSVVQTNADLCWTTCSILSGRTLPQLTYFCPEAVKKRTSIIQQLGILQDPPVEKVINHIQNVCDKLKHIGDKNAIFDSGVALIDQMVSRMYEWMNDKIENNSAQISKALRQKPIVFLKKRKIFVTCERIIRSLNSRVEPEIVPYLMEAPDEYGQYFKLFELLGMNKNSNVCNYARVLSHLKIDVGTKKLDPNMLKVVKRAYKQILSRIMTEEDRFIKELAGVGDLYVLARNGTLVNAREVVFSDNKDFEDKIGDDIGRLYMASNEDLDIYVAGTTSDQLKCLPKNMQPYILSDMIVERLDVNSMVKTSDNRGTCLVEFLDSNYFFEALVRISMQCTKELFGKKLEPVQIQKLMKDLEKIKVEQVESIPLQFMYNNSVVGHDERLVYFTSGVEQEETEHTLFCCFKELDLKEWLIKCVIHLNRVLMETTDGIYFDNKNLLPTVLTYVDNPNDISKALDEAKVMQYNVSRRERQSMFPTTGTRVHEEWHTYLDNSFTIFEVGDYVALLISEEDIENDTFIPAVYIYAKIVETLPVTSGIPILGNALRYYIVDVGTGRKEQKAAFDCFKFNCKTPERSNELAIFLDISESQIDDRPLDSIKREIRDIIKAAWTLPEDQRKRIIKRLYKKWHPDKNLGNIPVATEAFKYIKHLVNKMERGEDIEHESDTKYREPPNSSPFGQYFRTWERDTREDTNYTRQRREGSAHHSSDGRKQNREEVPSVAEARQWMRQARTDFLAAEKFLPHADSGPHFNWICLMLYQCTEKALKALHYNKDGNNVPSTTNLSSLAAGFSPELEALVLRLTQVVGNRDNLMYPDKLQISKIPAELCSKNTATSAKDITREILEFVGDRL